jgi:hypothetical protein
MKRALLLTAIMSGLLYASPSAAQQDASTFRLLLVSVPNAEVRTESGLYCETPCFIEPRRAGKHITFSKDGYRDVTLAFPLKRIHGEARDIAQNADLVVSREYVFVRMGSQHVDLNDNMPTPPPEFYGPHPPIKLNPMPQPTPDFSASGSPQTPEKVRPKN